MLNLTGKIETMGGQIAMQEKAIEDKLLRLQELQDGTNEAEKAVAEKVKLDEMRAQAMEVDQEQVANEAKEKALEEASEDALKTTLASAGVTAPTGPAELRSAAKKLLHFKHRDKIQ
ncbi:unnamed protein product, partial [Prorocentrum cordatum]